MEHLLQAGEGRLHPITGVATLLWSDLATYIKIDSTYPLAWQTHA